jgi:hypothetical protein
VRSPFTRRPNTPASWTPGSPRCPRLGLHARHIGIRGDTTPWQRREVEGITLHIRHLDLPIGDLVLLWNTGDPSFMATDLGSGLERLR